MDRLNDKLRKKDLGAFYTPIPYVQKAHELLYKAIERVPEGHDYIILDRCAGTGNLLEGLPSEIMEHFIVSTAEYYEWKILIENYGKDVRHIIPSLEDNDTFNDGFVRGNDALSKEYIEQDLIMKYANDSECNVIIFENPPYTEVNGTTSGSGKSSSWKNSYVVQSMKESIKQQPGTPHVVTNDMANAFIWSAYEYYLMKEHDFLIIFSPVKYWKSQNLVQKEFIDGYLFNRKHFYTKINAGISCIMWGVEDSDSEEIELKAYDIDEGEVVEDGRVKIKKVKSTFSQKYYDKRDFPNDKLDGITCELNGLERLKTKSSYVKTKYNENIVGYLVANGTGFDNPDLNSGLTIVGRYDSYGAFI